MTNMTHPKGFTLIELMITIAIGSVALLLLLGCIGGAVYYFVPM